VGDEGLEESQDSWENCPSGTTGGADSGAFSSESSTVTPRSSAVDDRLADVIAAWPSMSERTKNTVLNVITGRRPQETN